MQSAGDSAMRGTMPPRKRCCFLLYNLLFEYRTWTFCQTVRTVDSCPCPRRPLTRESHQSQQTPTTGMLNENKSMPNPVNLKFVVRAMFYRRTVPSRMCSNVHAHITILHALIRRSIVHRVRAWARASATFAERMLKQGEGGRVLWRRCSLFLITR
jgi:hypothetical protein